MRKIPFPLMVLGIVVVLAGLVGISIMTGFIPISALTGFYAFVFSLVLISIMGIIGAIFVGMFISHKVFSSREFTTFEEEMLKMKRDIEYIRKRLEEMEDLEEE
ncbi:MAG: hypothetical protein ACQESD_06025 [Thermoplasmatota archaeon]